jgi:hypothetical protein
MSKFEEKIKKGTMNIEIDKYESKAYFPTKDMSKF